MNIKLIVFIGSVKLLARVLYLAMPKKDLEKARRQEGTKMKNLLRIAVILVVVTASTGIANAGIIITNRKGDAGVSEKPACTEESEKSLTGIIITNITGIIITNLTGIIIVNATDDGQVNCGIIITN